MLNRLENTLNILFWIRNYLTKISKVVLVVSDTEELGPFFIAVFYLHYSPAQIK